MNRTVLVACYVVLQLNFQRYSHQAASRTIPGFDWHNSYGMEKKIPSTVNGRRVSEDRSRQQQTIGLVNSAVSHNLNVTSTLRERNLTYLFLLYVLSVNLQTRD